MLIFNFNVILKHRHPAIKGFVDWSDLLFNHVNQVILQNDPHLAAMSVVALSAAPCLLLPLSPTGFSPDKRSAAVAAENLAAKEMA